jgi:hypothetical protein
MWAVIITVALFASLELSSLLILRRIQKQIDGLSITTTPFWAVFQREVAESLHHPHAESQELDRYLEKLEMLTLTDEETETLESLLKSKAGDKNETQKERDRAELLLFAMPRVVSERKDAEKLLEIRRNQRATDAEAD